MPRWSVSLARAALVRGDLHQPTHPGAIDRHERVGRHELALLVQPHELADVVAAEPERGLGQIVRAEREEVGGARDLGGRHRRTRQLDHRAPLQVRQLDARRGQHLGRDRLELGAHLLQLADRRHQRDHDLDLRIAAGRAHLAGGLDDRPHLHRVQARLEDARGARRAARASGSSRAAGAPSRARPPGRSRPRRARARARPPPTGRSCPAGTRAAAGRAAAPSPATHPSPGRCRRSRRAAAAAARRRPPALPRWSRRRSSAAPRATRSEPRNMCSVRHRPIPSAPRARAFVDCSGVSALARTRMRRRASATCISRSKASQIGSCRACSSPWRAFSSTESASGSSPTKTLPVKPSIVIVSPSRTTVPFAVNERASHVEADLVGAADGRDALPARDDRRVGVRAAGAREDALGGDHAVVVVRRRLTTHEDDPRALVLGSALGLVGAEDDGSGRGARATRSGPSRSRSRPRPAPGA